MKFFFFLLLLGFMVLFSCGRSSKINTKNLIASAQLQSTANTAINVGSADFYLQKDGQIAMVMKINIKEKANSSVAVHFHEHGDCGNKGDNTTDTGTLPKKTMDNGVTRHSIREILGISV